MFAYRCSYCYSWTISGLLAMDASSTCERRLLQYMTIISYLLCTCLHCPFGPPHFIYIPAGTKYYSCNGKSDYHCYITQRELLQVARIANIQYGERTSFIAYRGLSHQSEHTSPLSPLQGVVCDQNTFNLLSHSPAR